MRFGGSVAAGTILGLANTKPSENRAQPFRQLPFQIEIEFYFCAKSDKRVLNARETMIDLGIGTLDNPHRFSILLIKDEDYLKQFGIVHL